MQTSEETDSEQLGTENIPAKLVEAIRQEVLSEILNPWSRLISQPRCSFYNLAKDNSSGTSV